MKKIIEDFKETGNCLVNIDNLISEWNHLWLISQYGDKYRLIRYLRKDSPIIKIKVTISELQAKELIDKLSLKSLRDSAFKRAVSWRKGEVQTVC